MSLSALLVYLGTLALTQTTYGYNYFGARWFALAGLFVFLLVRWIFGKRGQARGVGTGLVVLYLSLTSLTVIFAENPFFSFFRWGTHAMMLLVFLVLLRNSVDDRDVYWLWVAVRVIIGGLVIHSILFPSQLTVFDNPALFRGSMGNANNLGQVAAIGSLFFLHAAFTDRSKWTRRAQAVLAAVCIMTAWKTGSRSAMVLIVAGSLLLGYYYRRVMRGRILVALAVCSVLLFVFPSLLREAVSFVFKTSTMTTGEASEYQILRTRTDPWSDAWEGFRGRPLFGWGFGASSAVPHEWRLQYTSYSVSGRDAVSDILQMLEGGGLVGFASYVLLVYIALKQAPVQSEVRSLRAFKGNEKTLTHEELAEHMHAVLFTVAVGLLAMVQADNTALSAGNFVSVILWLCVGASGVLRISARGEEKEQLQKSPAAVPVKTAPFYR